MQNATQQTKDKSDVEIGKNSLITSPADMAGTIGRAMASLAERGLRAERVIVADHMPELDSLSQVTLAQANAIREGMKNCAFWKITLDEKAPAIDLTPSGTGGLAIRASIREGTLSIDLTGRLDTITAPDLLAFFEATREEHPVDAVVMNCSCLDYVSSAGLRVIMIMRKACPRGVTLADPNESVTEVLNQTGFAAVLTII